MANQFLSLSLFLMLLSFFIVLNAISSFEEVKSQPVLNSLSLAFSQEAVKEDLQSPSQEVNPRAVENEGDTLDKIEGLFQGHIAGFDATKNRLGTVMHVRVPIIEFESAIDVSELDFLSSDQQGRGSFAQTIVTVLRSGQNNNPYRIDMLLNIPQDPATQMQRNPGEFRAELKRVSGYANILQENGLPKKTITIGLTQGDSGYIDLYFRRYEPFDLSAKIKAAEDL
ncbi:MAG: hypothetical protein ACRBCK_05195 [Alphaproteobacteria bacterium]